MEEKWQDPDYNPPDTPLSKLLDKLAFYTVVPMCVAFFITFGIQLSYIHATGSPAMSWWWVFAPIWIPVGLIIIALLIVIGILLLIIKPNVEYL
jgi:hypothetical protein